MVQAFRVGDWTGLQKRVLTLPPSNTTFQGHQKIEYQSTEIQTLKLLLVKQSYKDRYLIMN